jgi:hypothetical protein
MEEELAGVGVALTRQQQKVILVASVPLTDEPRRALGEGVVVVLTGGEVLENRLPG